ncbi:hypothetical protein [Neobacillus mesonae]|uniref:hypothetical protein n=1 Tax=Neobacillus mesonae TaxID=1193713 RepID=UPI002E1ECED3|nr:hypothetical protein [Neobacillus mesonae]
MPIWLKDLWNWFWYYRRGEIKYHVSYFGNTFGAMATNGKVAVFNCYGSTPETAKEMALFNLNKAIKETMVVNDE